jgi:hypothetical protein
MLRQAAVTTWMLIVLATCHLSLLIPQVGFQRKSVRVSEGNRANCDVGLSNLHTDSVTSIIQYGNFTCSKALCGVWSAREEGTLFVV